MNLICCLWATHIQKHYSCFWFQVGLLRTIQNIVNCTFKIQIINNENEWKRMLIKSELRIKMAWNFKLLKDIQYPPPPPHPPLKKGWPEIKHSPLKITGKFWTIIHIPKQFITQEYKEVIYQMEEFVLEKILYHTTFLSKTHSGYNQGWFKRPLPSAQCHHSKKPHKCKDDSMNIYFISYPVIFLLTVILHPVVSNPTSVAL